MKKAILMLYALLCITATTTGAGEKVKTIEIKTTIYCDHCKKCGSCGARIENNLYDQKGVKRVDVDDKNMTIKIAYQPEKTSPEALRNIIAAHGYDADDIKATPEAIAQLDDCCQPQE